MYVKMRCRHHLVSVALFCLCLLSLFGDAVLGSKMTETTAENSNNNDHNIQGVIDLTSKNFGSSVSIGDGNIWLIEFYTPGCIHCRNFASSYESIAHTFHSDPEQKVKVGRVDCTVEKALMTRFGVQAFPSFFLISGLNVYEFEEGRSISNLINFAKNGYKKKNPVPFLNSAMGPMGQLQGILIFVGTNAMGVLDSIQDSYGISPIISAVILCIIGVFGGMISIILLTLFSTLGSSREKLD